MTGLTHGNGLITTASYDQDYRLSGLNVKNGAAIVSNLAYACADGVNLTGNRTKKGMSHDVTALGDVEKGVSNIAVGLTVG